MLAAAAKAFAQMFSPPFRAVLFKSAGLALLVLIALGVGLQRLLSFAVDHGGAWLASFGYVGQSVIGWVDLALTVIASLGLAVALIFLVPAATSLVASVFADGIAEKVERAYYPHDSAGTPPPLGISLWESVKTALFGILIYLCAVPFLLFAGIGAVIFFIAAAYLLGREYFLLAAMRFHPASKARALRREHRAAIFRAGLLIAAFVSIPILNLATPLFATAYMVHIHKRLSDSRRPAMAAAR